MGGHTFSQYEPGVDAEAAFRRAVDEATYEHGHDGYNGTISTSSGFVYIERTPMLMSEAEALADRLIEERDPRINDKWGPAGAIAVISRTRTASVKDFSYVHDNDWRRSNEQPVQPALLEAVKGKVKLHKGETISDVSLTIYNQPDPPLYGRRPARQTRSGCSATVTINKPPSTRTFTITAEIPGGLDYETFGKEVGKAARAAKVRAGESYVSHRVVKDEKGKAKVTAVAPKGATQQKFVLLNERGHAIHGLAHDTWAKGFDSQAEARAWLTKVFNNPDNDRFWHEDVLDVEIVGITRRVDGQPLVKVTREVTKRTVTIEVEARLANAPVQTTPDGWLFFGWAAS